MPQSSAHGSTLTSKAGNHQPLNLRLRRPTTPTGAAAYWARFTRIAKKWGKSIHEFLTVPMYAALISIVIALIPPLQEWMKELKPVEQAIRSAGACSSMSSLYHALLEVKLWRCRDCSL